MKITFNSTFEQIGNSLMTILSEIENNGDTPQLKAEMLFNYGIVHFFQGNFDKSYKVFEQCNIHIIDNGLPQNIEIYYWIGRIFEEKGNLEKAKSAYMITFKQMKETNNVEFTNELLDRISNIEK